MKTLTQALMVTTLAAGVAVAGGAAYAADLAQGVVSEPAPAAASQAYVGIFGGAALSTSVDGTLSPVTDASVALATGYALGVTVGTHVMSSLRGELELSYSSRAVTALSLIGVGAATTAATGTGAAWYGLGNLWYDFDLGSGFTPYLGVGAGVAELKVTTNIPGALSANMLAPALQAGAGIKFDVSDNLAIDVGYRAKYVFNGQLSALGGTLTSVHYLDQSVQAGITYGF